MSLFIEVLLSTSPAPSPISQSLVHCSCIYSCDSILYAQFPLSHRLCQRVVVMLQRPLQVFDDTQHIWVHRKRPPWSELRPHHHKHKGQVPIMHCDRKRNRRKIKLSVSVQKSDQFCLFYFSFVVKLVVFFICTSCPK